MNFFRRLTVPPNPLAGDYVTAMPAHPASTGAVTAAPEYDMSADDQHLIACMAFLAANAGVITTDTPGLPISTSHQEAL